MGSRPAETNSIGDGHRQRLDQQQRDEHQQLNRAGLDGEAPASSTPTNAPGSVTSPTVRGLVQAGDQRQPGRLPGDQGDAVPPGHARATAPPRRNRAER